MAIAAFSYAISPRMMIVVSPVHIDAIAYRRFEGDGRHTADAMPPRHALITVVTFRYAITTPPHITPPLITLIRLPL